MEPFAFYFNPRSNSLLYTINEGTLYKATLPDGKTQQIHGSYPGLTGDFSSTVDGKEIIYSDQHAKGKLVMIENLFK